MYFLIPTSKHIYLICIDRYEISVSLNQNPDSLAPKVTGQKYPSEWLQVIANVL